MDNRYINNQNQFQSNYYQQNPYNQNRGQDAPDISYSSSGTSRKNKNNNFNNNMNQNINYPNIPKSNNLRNEENSKPFQISNNAVPRTTMNRDVKYDEFRQPRNTEFITTTSLPKKSNLEELQQNNNK